MKKQVLIVDGYNMIGAWPELVQLKKQDLLEEARDLLLVELSNYAKFEKNEVIVVFDAMNVPGITRNYQKYSLEVIFTKEDQTADSYIEWLTGEKNNIITQVSVATSDLSEQWVVFSQGALRVSARELYKRIYQSKEETKTLQEEINQGTVRRNSPWNKKQLNFLDNFRKDLENR